MQVSCPPTNAPEQPQVPPTRFDWISTVFFAVVHVLAFVGAVKFFSWSALGVLVVMHWLTGSIGICLGYHRLLSHRSFQVPKWLEYVFATVGALAIEGGPIFWVSSHRQHHAFTEHEHKDPYSARRGFWWSHMMWLLFQQEPFFRKEVYQPMAPDISRNPYYRFLDTYFLLLQIPLAGVLYLLGGWPFVVYGVLMRAVTVWHTTWLINSASHIWGYRRFECNDNARNLWWTGLLAYGEGWHNNHHADPKCAKAGLTWWEIDMTYWAIWLMAKVGLATKVRTAHSPVSS